MANKNGSTELTCDWRPVIDSAIILIAISLVVLVAYIIIAVIAFYSNPLFDGTPPFPIHEWLMHG